MPDSPDSDTRQHDNVPVVGRIRSFEKLVEPKRSMSLLGVARVDDPDAVSQTLAEDVSKKAFKLLVTIHQMDSEGETRRYECQVGLIREGSLDALTVRPVTAKHNIANARVEGVLEQFRMAELLIPKTGIQKHVELVFQESGCAYTDHNECDVTWGQQVEHSTLVLHSSSFQRARDDFRCEPGQKVAIVIYSENGATPDSALAPPGYTQEELERIYGKANQINILTGVITEVGPDYICYNINTFGGCSGAVVFLLDKEQPDSVKPRDWGKAIAVHIGPHPSSRSNMAFLLSGYGSN
jgi:hypothetical protein